MSDVLCKVRLLVFPAIASVIVGCGSSTSTTAVTGPSLTKCQVALTPGVPLVEASGGTASVSVSTQPECAWTASTDESWITGLNPAAGQGGGEIRFQVAPNPAVSTRQADIVLNDVHVKISQAGAACRFDITPRSQTIPAAGGTGTVAMTSLTGCTWTVTSDAPWLTATSTGGGSATITFSAGSNPGGARVGRLTIADQTIVVTQQALDAARCAYHLEPASRSLTSEGGKTSVTLRTDATCSWKAAANATWLSVVGATAGLGDGTVTVSASPNAGPARTGTVTIAEQTFTVEEAGTVEQAGPCVSAINPTSQSVTAAGGQAATVAVTVAAGCPWTATTATPWLTITAGGGGAGNGVVTFAVAANSGPARTGSVSIAGQLHTVNQANGCNFAVNSTTAAPSASGGPGMPVAVTSAAGCEWTATSHVSWITIATGASGTGNGAVTYSVAANPGAARTGTMTVATRTFTVTQGAVCSYSISPTSQSFNKNANSGDPIAVTATPGCTWTAVSNDSWITVETGASEVGNGVVTFKVDKNGNKARVGTMTIAGSTFTVQQDH